MFWKDCRYNLCGLTANRCPECGRAFDPSDPQTFSEWGRRFEMLRAQAVRTRAAVVAAIALVWSLTSLGAPVSEQGMVSGPFMLLHVWGWWPGNAMTAAVGLGVLTPALVWIATGRLIFLALTVLAVAASIAFSFWAVLGMAASC